MSSPQYSRSPLQRSSSKALVSLLAILSAPQLAHGATQLSFFEHSSCNAGTSFQSYDDPNALQADTSCHQLPNGTVALYVHQIDDGCTCMYSFLLPIALSRSKSNIGSYACSDSMNVSTAKHLCSGSSFVISLKANANQTLKVTFSMKITSQAPEI